MPELFECRLDRIGKYYRWQAFFRLGSGRIHTAAVAHNDPEVAVQHLSRLVDSVVFLFSKEYGRA